ncbi:MAG TPA: aminoacyl-tRNA hydrolase [Longimicrobiales bacterium]|nr:aminoacyl-tRNA hydrolase [Longimicrobiales bacterium]
MKLVCGLGNPGPEYASTRHNVGWWVVDRLRREWEFGRFSRKGATLMAAGWVDQQEVALVKPLTYMNRSGTALLQLLADFPINVTTDLLVVVDDTALPVGRLRFRAHGSAGGHNGLKSVESALQTREYARLRIGVGARPAGVDLADYVLSDFLPAEAACVLELVPVATNGIRIWVEEGIESAMRCSNR